jgi:flavin-dependent dehydrogenase
MQTHPEEYDVVVLGSGEAGKYIAWTLARKGMRAIVIERKYRRFVSEHCVSAK